MTGIRGFRRLVVTAVIAASAVAGVSWAGPASAHAYLQSTSPTDGAVVAALPAAVTVTFDQAPVAQFSTIRVTGPDGTNVDDAKTVQTGSVLKVALHGPSTHGLYTVHWRVVSIEGHTEISDFTFRVGPPGPRNAVAAATPAPRAGTSAGFPLAAVAVLTVIALGALAVGGWALARRGRRRGALPPAEARAPAHSTAAGLTR